MKKLITIFIAFPFMVLAEIWEKPPYRPDEGHLPESPQERQEVKEEFSEEPKEKDEVKLRQNEGPRKVRSDRVPPSQKP